MALRILAVDYGTRRTGLAVADDEVRVATPLQVIETADLPTLAAAIQAAVEREGADRVVVGLPLNMDGTAGPMAEAAAALAEALRERTGLTVDLYDERLTSHAAEGRLAGMSLTKAQRRRRVDALAAMILLQSYLNRGGAGSG